MSLSPTSRGGQTGGFFSLLSGHIRSACHAPNFSTLATKGNGSGVFAGFVSRI